jgi:hypothetical protein
MMAALVSADKVLGTSCAARIRMGDLNRHLGYRRGRATPVNAPMTPLFTRFIEGLGLEVRRSTAISGAFEELKRITTAEDCSFPIVGVDLELIPEYDRRVTIKRIPIANGPAPATDHALVILAADDSEVQFFDPTLRNPTGTLVEEKIDTPTFLRRWNEDPIIPNDRVWFVPLRRGSRKPARVARRTLMEFNDKGDGSKT